MPTPRALAAAVLAGLALVATACGGGPSKADFVKEANAVCTDLEKSLEKLGESNPESADELAQTVDDLQKEVDAGITRLKDIELPGGEDGDKAKAFVDEFSTQVEDEIQPAFADLKKGAQEQDQKLLSDAAQQLQSIDSEKADKLAREAGANECAG